MTLAHLVGILERQRTGGQIARVGIVLAALHQEAVEVVVADDSLAADDGMPLGLDGLRYSCNG